MMHLPASVRVYLCASACDMRKSFDGLHALVTQSMDLDAFAGHLFVFANRRRDRIKILYWDRDGFAVWAKRLEEGTYAMPFGDTAEKRREITAAELGEGNAKLQGSEAPEAIPAKHRRSRINIEVLRIFLWRQRTFQAIMFSSADQPQTTAQERGSSATDGARPDRAAGCGTGAKNQNREPASTVTRGPKRTPPPHRSSETGAVNRPDRRR